MRKNVITKEELMRLGVTEVTEDGRVFRDGYEMKPQKVWAKHKWGKDKYYYVLIFYDPLVYAKQAEMRRKTKNGVRPILLHRVVYAWFHCSTPLDTMDICHLDDNPDNNNINNLKAVTHRENINMRKGNKCKYTTDKWKEEHNEAN